MPFDIRSLVDAVETREVLLRGKSITIRALSASTMVAIESALPAPIAPDEHEKKHPAFRAMVAQHYARKAALIVGVSAEIIGHDGQQFVRGRESSWAEAYADHILGVLTEQEVMRLYKMVGDICDSLTRPDAGRIGSESVPGN